MLCVFYLSFLKSTLALPDVRLQGWCGASTSLDIGGGLGARDPSGA